MKIRKRIESLNFVKFICALLVLYIHVPISTDLFLYQMPTRLAVPMFFIISAFFWGREGDYRKIVGGSARCFARYFFWVALTFIYEGCKIKIF